MGNSEITTALEAPRQLVNVPFGNLLPWILSAMILITAVVAASTVKNNQAQYLESAVAQKTIAIHSDLKTTFDMQLAAFRRKADRWENADVSISRAHRQDGINYLEDLPGLTTILWLTNDSSVGFIETKSMSSEIAKAISLIEEHPAYRDFQSDAAANPAYRIDLFTFDDNFAIIAPLHHGGVFHGFLVGVYDLNVFLGLSLPESFLNDFDLVVSNDNGYLFQSAGNITNTPNRWANKIIFEYYDADLQLTIWPEQKILKKINSFIDELLILGGGFLSLLIFYLTYLSRRYKAIGQRRKEDQRRIEAVLNAAPCAIFSVDESGAILSANPYAEQLFELDRTDFEGKHLQEFVVLPSDDDEAERALSITDSRTIDSEGVKVKALCPTGADFPAMLLVREIAKRKKTDFVAVLTDLSEQERLMTAKADLAEQKRMDQMKSEFVSTVSHELRTPLTSIKGSLGLFRSSLLGELSEHGRSMIDIAYSNCDRLVRLINDILDLEKIEAGKLSFVFEQTELSPLLAHTIETNRAYAREHNVDIVLEDADEKILIETDPDRFEQVVTNLLSNAVKFSPNGATVRVCVELIGDDVRISIIDSGPGISDEFQTRIFRRFSQADSSDDREKGGTGLGLSISKAIIDAHGGTIDFDTSAENGSAFYFDLPRIKPDSDTGLATGNYTNTILICEDDADIARLLSMLIADMGFESKICTTAEHAKTLLSQNTFAAMTLDLTLPGQNGIDLIRELRENPDTINLPIIIVSAATQADMSELDGDAVSVIDWLQKPIDENALRNCIGVATQLSQDGGGIRILHVEDDDDHLMIVQNLVGATARLDMARSCESARALLRENDYDLVILDLQLPDGRGEALFSEINAKGENSPQVLVFSVQELSETLMPQVRAAMIKSRTSNEALRKNIRAAIGAPASQTELKSVA